MKIKNLKKTIKRVMALALCAGCLAAVCSQSASAAAPAIQLEYTDNHWAPASGDTRYSGGILSGGTLNVRMDLGEFSLISGTNALRATSLSNNVSDSDYTFTVDTNEGAGVYTVKVELLNGKEEAELQVSGNTSTITPTKDKITGKQIYDGRVFTQGGTGSSFGTAGLDITESQVVLTEESRLTIVCERGQGPNNSTPSFKVIPEGATSRGELTGIFKGYEGSVVSVGTCTSSSRPNDPNREIAFLLIPPATSGLKTLSFTFKAPPSTFSDILDPNDSTKRLTAQGVSYDPNDKDGTYYGYAIENNYLRAGTSYVMTFSPPSSTLLGLAVATKEHVANQILRNIQTNAEDSYIQWVGDDTEDLIANDSFGLKTADHRYNADFYITYQWKPDKEGDEGVITFNQESGSDSGVAYVHRKVDDVRGQLLVGIRLRGENSYLIGTGDPTAKPEPTLVGEKVFDIVIRGSGEPASTLLMSSTTGATPDEATGNIGADIVETKKYTHPDPKDSTKTLPGENLNGKTYDMDVFAGRVASYFAPPLHPYQYQINLNMGRKNAAAAFVVVTADQQDIVELRLPESREPQYMPRVSSEVYAERRGYRLSDIPVAARINNLSTNSNVEQTMQMLVTAKNAGDVTLTFQYFVLIGNSYYVDSTHTATFKVVDTSPSSDSTLSNLTIQAATEDRKVYDFGFKPNVTDYTSNVLELPYICTGYQIQPLINDRKCQHLPVYVTARDIKGTDVTDQLFPENMLQKDKDGNVVKDESGSKVAIVSHGGTLPMTITQDSQVYSLTFHFVAQNPNAHTDYRVDVMRVPPSTDDRLATLTFYDERDKTQTTQLLKDFDPDVTTYVMDVPFGAKRLKVGAVQSFPQALVEFDPLLQTLNYDPDKPEEPKWVPREYLDLRALEESEKYGVMPGYGNLPYFEIKVMPESEHKDLFDKDGNRELVGARFTRTYRIYIHRMDPSDNSRLAAQSGIVVINSAEISNNPRALPFSPPYNAFTTGYFMTGRQALPFSTKEVRFKITPADPTATVYIYSISEVGEPVVTPTPKPTEEPEPTPEGTPASTPEGTPAATSQATPVSTPESTPVSTPEGTPAATPESTPVSTPEATPAATPEGTPAATPEVIPTPTATASTTGTTTQTGIADAHGLSTKATLTGTGLAPFLGIGRSNEPDPTRPTSAYPMILETFGEYTSPIALEARRENGSFGTNELHILVVSEAGSVKDYKELIKDAEAATHDPDLAKFYTLYKLEIERLPASTDADLTNVVVRDISGKEQKLFNFHKDETSYEFTVPYEAERVSFTPTLSYPIGATVQLKDSGNVVHEVAGSIFPNLLDNLASGVESRLYNLNDWRGEPRTFTLIVKSEAFNDSRQSEQEKWDQGLAKEYTFTIRRGAPSTDARLRRLDVSGITDDGISPVFKASQLSYTATVAPGGNNQITITPTVNEPHATIMWWEEGDERGAQRVQSGTATDPIELVEEHTVICVRVTAQDGETKQTYKIDFYNPNVVDLTDNADLASLKVERGVMTPEFDPAVITYEVAVKEDTYAVSIIPKPADPLAAVQVFEGTREMGDYNNNYALALKNGANTVTVRVTSADGTRVKDYTVTIYRNDEENQKTLKPLTAEDLGEEIFKDPAVNPIIVSVVEYPRIQSDVFQALKDATAEDPNKTLVLQGNDFSLTFRGADLDTIIPTREIYDFSMSFSSPDEARINELVGGWAANVDVLGEVVMVYFDYHGDLPGTATLHINVGNKYASQPLFWHYYNRERDRIDYYGTVHSNSQGTFAVLIDHFSTYLVTRYHMIAGAEDRSGSVSLNVNSLGANGKINPQTGAGQHHTGDKP